MPQEYERDEFDEIAEQGGPVGVHRRPIPWWSRVLTPIVAFLVAGLLAYGVAMGIWWFSGRSSGQEPASSVTSTPEVSDSPTVSPEPSADPTVSPSPSPSVSPSPEPTPQIVADAQIHVRNGSGVSGIAGKQQEILEADGFTNVEANNISSSLIPGGVNTVVYSDPRLADTANKVAEDLGIETVTQGDTPGGAEIEVLLASDPS